MDNKILDLITEEEKSIYEEFLKTYVFPWNPSDVHLSNANANYTIENSLRAWAKAKKPLIEKIFKDKLILEREIDYNMRLEDVEEVAEKELLQKWRSSFIRSFTDFINNMIETYPHEEWEVFNYIFQKPHFYRNRWRERDTPVSLKIPNSDKQIKICKDMKVSRTFSILAREFPEEEFAKKCSEFLDDYSLFLSKTRVKGTFCLSIHPLDYLTMSDNENDWSSCLSVMETGGYCGGAVELMNSPVSIIAYLRSNENKLRVGPHTWNSKAWRNIFIITDDIITAVKGYPYKSSILDNAILRWIKEFFPEGQFKDDPTSWSLNCTCDPGERESSYVLLDGEIESREISFYTNYTMYNDFGRGRIRSFFPNTFKKEISIEYSSRRTCLACGEPDNHEGNFIDTDYVICRKCFSRYCCSLCGEDIDETNTVVCSTGRLICLDCGKKHDKRLI